MQASDIPTKFAAIWASGAGGTYITTPIPLTTTSPGRASLDLGFPPTTFEPEGSGGNPPYGKDANGILNMVTAWLQWQQAGGAIVGYDATFQGQVSGYPNGALLKSATAGHYWQSTADNNATDPDTGGAGWQMFPDVLIQKQAGNYTATDGGAANAPSITLSPAPASWAAIAGAPLRFIIANAVTVTNPTLTVAGIGAKTMVNTDGTGISTGQISRAGQFVEGFYDVAGDKVQITTPPKPAGGGAVAVLQPGMILMCPNATPFTGTLECDGSILLITAYPNLFNSIGNKYGGVPGTSFALPDLRGEFVRGWDHGRGLDPNASTRTNRGDGTTGNYVGTNQGFTAGPISISNGDIQIANLLWHLGTLDGPPPYPYPTSPPPVGGGYWYQIYDNNNMSTFATPVQDGFSRIPTVNEEVAALRGSVWLTGQSGSPETRPVNIYLMYVIVY